MEVAFSHHYVVVWDRFSLQQKEQLRGKNQPAPGAARPWSHSLDQNAFLWIEKSQDRFSFRQTGRKSQLNQPTSADLINVISVVTDGCSVMHGGIYCIVHRLMQM